MSRQAPSADPRRDAPAVAHDLTRGAAVADRVLWVAIDVGSREHEAFLAPASLQLRRRLRFRNNREGFLQLESTMEKSQTSCQATEAVIGMEPSGVFWKPLYAYLKARGHRLVLVHAKAVKHNRQTHGDNASKTDRKDAFSIWDLLCQQKYFKPVARDAEQEAAYRLMHHYEDSRKRTDQIRNQLRTSLALAFPELNEQLKDLSGKTALSFLEKNPTPAQIKALGPQRFLHRWRGRRGPMGREYFEGLYQLAKRSIGVQDPMGSLAEEIQTLAREFRHALEIQKHWFDRAHALLRHRGDYQLLRSIPRIGRKLAVGLLASLGRASDFRCGKQWVKLAGLDLRLFQSGQSLHKIPRISHQGDEQLRMWLYYAALNVVKYDGPFRALYLRRQKSSPGRGSKPRALMAVADKLARVIFAMLRDQRTYDLQQDQRTALLYVRPHA